MSLEEILKDIELRGKQEIEQLTLYYQKRISDLEVRQAAALKLQGEKIRKVLDEEKRTTERTIVSSAEMESLNVIRSKEGQLIGEASGKAELYLRSMRERKDYQEILARMVEIAHKTLGKDCRILVSKEDSTLIKAGDSKVVVREIDPYGGIKAESSDGSRELDLTITAIISEIREKLVAQFHEYLGE